MTMFRIHDMIKSVFLIRYQCFSIDIAYPVIIRRTRDGWVEGAGYSRVDRRDFKVGLK
jgi:hypothetical protein